MTSVMPNSRRGPGRPSSTLPPPKKERGLSEPRVAVTSRSTSKGRYVINISLGWVGPQRPPRNKPAPPELAIQLDLKLPAAQKPVQKPTLPPRTTPSFQLFSRKRSGQGPLNPTRTPVPPLNFSALNASTPQPPASLRPLFLKKETKTETLPINTLKRPKGGANTPGYLTSREITSKHFANKAVPLQKQPTPSKTPPPAPPKQPPSTKDLTLFPYQPDSSHRLLDTSSEEGLPPSPSLPSFESQYTLGGLIGRGSFAEVFRATRKSDEFPVAVKRFPLGGSAPGYLARARGEKTLLARLDHPNVVGLIDWFESPEFLYLVMELVEGGDLRTRLLAKGAVPEKEFRPILKQLLSALGHLHSRRVLHRDVKPDNVLLTRSGEVKICDFGVSKVVEPNGEVMVEFVGSPMFVAPEVVARKGYRGFKSDLWALGVLSYVALFFKPPFKATQPEKLNEEILNKKIELPLNPPTSAEMKIALGMMLEKNPQKRGSADKVAAVFGWTVEPVPSGSSPTISF